MSERFDLDDQAQLALDVARHAAVANGDSRCGTEYLLYGLVATARGELVELLELFALNVLRIDHSIERIIERRRREGTFVDGPPVLSRRATRALETCRLDGDGPTGVFEVMHGLLEEDGSGACVVLRDLGVQPEEARRLVGYGLQHLSRAEVDELIATLDRRNREHRPWWGPPTGASLPPLPVLGPDTRVFATSASAEIELTTVASDDHGLGFTLVARSRSPWMLPPMWEPAESLVPGQGARITDGPDFVLVQVIAADGTAVDNRHVEPRYVAEAPPAPRLIRLGTREERRSINDRRSIDQTVVTVDWWVWPLPTPGVVELRIDWPAESISGLVSFDASRLHAG